MNKFAEAYPGDESKGKHTTASEIVRSLVDGFLNDLSTDATRVRDAKDIPRNSRFVKL